MTRLVEGFHDTLAEGVDCIEYGVAAAVRQSVKEINASGYEFFHDVISVGLGLEKSGEILVAVEPISRDGADTVIRFGD